MRKENINIVAVFRQRIKDGVYNFDVMAVGKKLDFSILVGSIVCNIHSAKIVITMSKSIDSLSQKDINLLKDDAAEYAKALEETIFS